MNISQRQLMHAMDEIIKEEFASGRVPVLRTIMQKLNQRFEGKSLGLPLFSIRFAEGRTLSSSSDWNKMMAELESDLSLLFSQHLYHSDLLMRRYDQLGSRMAAALERIEAANDKVLDLMLALESTEGYFYAEGDRFHSLEKVDMRRGETTAWIDLESGVVTPPLAKGANRKHLPKGTRVVAKAVYPEEAKLESISSPELALDDDTNTAWIGQVLLDEPGPAEIYFEAMFDPVSISRIVLYPEDASPSEITLRITMDGHNWHSLGTRISSASMVYDFVPQNVLGVRISMRQDAFERMEEDHYVYAFGLRSISLQSVGWEEEGQLVSQPIMARALSGDPAPLNRVALKVDEEVPTGSEIEYFVALDESDPIWHPISPQGRGLESEAPLVLSLGQITPVPAIKGIASSGQLYKTEGGVDFYGLYSINLQGQQLVPRSSRLEKGVGQWRRESFFFSHPDSPHHIPTLKDWTDSRLDKSQVLVRYQNAAENLVLPAGGNVNVRYITHIHATKSTSLNLSLRIPEGTFGLRFYVNNQSQADGLFLDGGTLRVPVGLDEGWNSLQILVYREGNQSPPLALSSHTSVSGLSYFQSRDAIAADLHPMIEVGNFDLFHNVPYRDDSSYTIVEQDRDSPLLVINEYTHAQQAVYRLSYRRNAEGAAGQSLRLKAILRSPGPDGPPPKLKGYTLLFGH